MKKIVKSFATVTVLSVLTRLFSMICKILLARALTSYELGVYQSGFSVFAITLTVISSGFPLAVSRFFAKGKGGERSLFASVSVCFALSLIITAVACSLGKNAALIFADEKSAKALRLLIPALIPSSIYCSLRGALWGKEKFFLFSFAEFFEELVYVLVVIGMVRFFPSYTIYIPCYAITISSVCSCIFVVIAYFSTGGKAVLPKKEDFPLLFKVSLPIISVRLLASATVAVIMLVLPKRLLLFGETKESALSLIGLFSGVVNPLLFAPSAIIGSLCLVLLPKLARSDGKEKRTVLYSLSFASILSALVAALYFSLAKELCFGVFGKKECDSLLRFSCIAVFPMSINQISASVLNGVGLERNALKSFIFGATASFLTVFLLSPIFSIYAQSLAITVQSAVSGAMNLFCLSKKLDIPVKYILKAFAPFSATVFLALVGNVAEKLFVNANPFVAIIAVGLIVIFLFTLSAYVIFPKSVIKALTKR